VRNVLSGHWPIIAATLLFLGLCTMLAVDMVTSADGNLIYIRDDAYIHLAMAKNLVQHGVWGVSKDEFSSATSSPLWTLLLAGSFLIFGIHGWIALVLNLIAAVLAIGMAYLMFRRWRLPPWGIFASLLLFAYVIPLHGLVFVGMEHTVHLLLVLVFVLLGYPRITAGSREQAPSLPWLFWVVTPLMVMARYESLALVAIMAILLLWRGHRKDSLAVVTLAFLPVAVYGIAAMSKGWSWLPNSILIKSGAGRGIFEVFEADHSMSQRADNLNAVLFKGSHTKIDFAYELGLILFVGFLLLVHRIHVVPSRLGPSKILLLITLGTTYAHVQWGAIKSYYRYEAYVVALGFMVLIPLVVDVYRHLGVPPVNRGRRVARVVALVVVLVLFLGPFLSRGGRSIFVLPRASANIFEQQYQMGRFVARYYDRIPIAANDIGAINYLADARCLDLVGLSSRQVSRDRRHAGLSTEMIQRWTDDNGTKIAIVYDVWFKDGKLFPDTWEKIGMWAIEHAYVCADEEVSFYAVDPDEASSLRAHLQEFRSELPDRVIQSGSYIKELDGAAAR